MYIGEIVSFLFYFVRIFFFIKYQWYNLRTYTSKVVTYIIGHKTYSIAFCQHHKLLSCQVTNSEMVRNILNLSQREGPGIFCWCEKYGQCSPESFTLHLGRGCQIWALGRF